MKKQHRRWISLFLVLVFILNGIFLDVPELHQAASQFTFANHKVVFSDQDTILHASANILRNADFCTEDLLGIQSRDASSLRGVRDGRRSNAKVRVFLSLVHILDSKISIFRKWQTVPALAILPLAAGQFCVIYSGRMVKSHFNPR